MSKFNNTVLLQFVSAQPDELLNKLTEVGIILMDVYYLDALTVEIRVYPRQEKSAEYVIKKNHGEVKTKIASGSKRVIYKCRKRPVFLLGLLLFFLATCIIPGRVLFLSVSGNESISPQKIIEEAQRAGISFGIRGKKIRSEEIKNRMLTAIPELQWVGINTSGCIATICVQERSKAEKSIDSGLGISNVVARQDGVIAEMNIEKGTPLVTLGQSVRAGDVLISGYADYENKLLVQNAKGEITAHTMRKNTCISPIASAKRGVFLDRHTCLGVRIGKKVIKFCNHSGIRDVFCVKMYLEDYCELPGGYRLPVSFIRAEYVYYSQEPLQQAWSSVDDWLPTYAKDYLCSQMVAGQILQSQLSWRYAEDHCQLSGIYACHEMIAEVKYEEIIEDNAEDN